MPSILLWYLGCEVSGADLVDVLLYFYPISSPPYTHTSLSTFTHSLTFSCQHLYFSIGSFVWPLEPILPANTAGQRFWRINSSWKHLLTQIPQLPCLSGGILTTTLALSAHQESQALGPTVETGLIIPASLPVFPFPTPLLVITGVTSQINDLPSNPCHRVLL